MKYIIIFVLGLVVGAGAAIFLLGVPRAKALPGNRVEAPSGETPPGTVMVSLSDSFVNELLATVFKQLNPPTFNLGSTMARPSEGLIRNAAFQGGCNNSVTLAPEAGSTKTQVQFANN